jgi:hypothetical protein
MDPSSAFNVASAIYTGLSALLGAWTGAHILGRFFSINDDPFVQIAGTILGVGLGIGLGLWAGASLFPGLLPFLGPKTLLCAAIGATALGSVCSYLGKSAAAGRERKFGELDRIATRNFGTAVGTTAGFALGSYAAASVATITSLIGKLPALAV